MKSKITIPILGVVVFVVLWIVFYPPIYAIHDEAAYMAQAYVMRSGTIFGDVAGINVVSSIKEPSGHLVTKYAPGTSFLLIPFTFIGWKTIFLLPLVLYLLGFFVFIKILKIYNIPPYFSLLYLLYPSSVLYSRTIMADIPSAVFFIIALYLFLKGKRFYFLSGLIFGFLSLFRYSNIILSIPFLIFVAIRFFKEIRKTCFLSSPFLKFVIGLLPGILILLFYNKIAFGGFFNTPLGVTGTFSLGFLPHNILFYVLSMSLIYPFMFFFIFFLRKNRLIFITTAFLFLLFYSLYSYFTTAPGRNMFKTLVVGMRYLLPITPIFILSYCDLLDRIRRKSVFLVNIFFWFLIGIFSILDLGMVYQHQRFLKKQEQYKNIIYENTDEYSLILTNYDGMEFFQPVWGKRKYTMFVYWRNKIPVDLSKYNFKKLYLLTVVRSDKEGNEYVRKYADEIVQEYNGQLVREVKGDPELRLWRLNYESTNDSVSEKR